MEKHISATDAVRDFSELLNRVRFRGEHYIIERTGKPMARIEPTDPSTKRTTLSELGRLLDALPRLGDELESFAADIEGARKAQLRLPEESQWE
jgi:antitoxin (DNA-binding transcriptional repressor) of toxin-antitoxin stability system